VSEGENHESRVARLRLRSLLAGQNRLDGDFAVSEFGRAVGTVQKGVASVLLTGNHENGLGAALLWATKNEATSLQIFSDRCAEVLARRATYFSFPIQVFGAETDGVAKPVVPAEFERPTMGEADESFAEFIAAGGADVVREHGVVSGEVNGLEVCRVVRDASGESRLEIGVGAHDRETFQMLHGRTATIESLRKVVVEVAARRAVGAQVHPLNQLARERMLRHQICLAPQLVGAKILKTAQPPTRRSNLKDAMPCCADGVLVEGTEVVATFGVGINPELVVFGADAREFLNPAADLILVVPSRDASGVLQRLAKLLRRSARIVGVDLATA